MGKLWLNVAHRNFAVIGSSLIQKACIFMYLFDTLVAWHMNSSALCPDKL